MEWTNGEFVLTDTVAKTAAQRTRCVSLMSGNRLERATA